jgi:hypothetical protein
MLEEISHIRRNHRRFLPYGHHHRRRPVRRDRFCESTVQQDNTGTSASDLGAADGARSNSITHY